MAVVPKDKLSASMDGLASLPALRQIGLMIGLSASVALGVAVVLWSQEPSYRVLYGELSDKSTSQVMSALSSAGIEHKLNKASGAVMVPGGKVHEARIQLASEGLPKESGVGYELLKDESGFGSSRFMETARYQRALQGELARTIGSLEAVESARVHLAMPERSVFVREQDAPTASVLVNLYSGRHLQQTQVDAVVHMVASSIPKLAPDNVSVVDQNGELLTEGQRGESFAESSRQFEFTRQIEQHYVQRIEDLLTPVLGPGKVRAEVVAEVDFTEVERTREQYDPDDRVVRSEETTEQINRGGAPSGGVPGALSNQPPGKGTTKPQGQAQASAQAGQQGREGEQGATDKPRRMTRTSVRNYEVDKTVSHTKIPAGTIKRVSAAVVVDHKEIQGDGQKVSYEPLSDAQMSRIENLVKDAVGFSSKRGDQVTVMNASFHRTTEEAPAPPEPAIWKQAWLWGNLKQVLGVLAAVMVAFGILRPLMRTLAQQGRSGAGGASSAQMLPTQEQPPMIPAQAGDFSDQGQTQAQADAYESRLNTAKGMAQQDPRLVAQVMKTWIGDDE